MRIKPIPYCVVLGVALVSALELGARSPADVPEALELKCNQTDSILAIGRIPS